MVKNNIDIPPLFKYSIRLFREHASFIIGLGTTYLILGIVPQAYMILYSPNEPNFESQLVSMIAMLVQLFLSLGLTKIMLYLVDDRPVEINDLINNGAVFLDYFVAYFLYFLAVGIGLLLIIPGIYLAIRLQFYPFYIIQNGDSSFSALQKSWYATEEWTLELFLFGICILFINFMGALCLLIGMVFTYPITIMATAIVFKGLDEEAEKIPTTKFLDE